MKKKILIILSVFIIFIVLISVNIRAIKMSLNFSDHNRSYKYSVRIRSIIIAVKVMLSPCIPREICKIITKDTENGPLYYSTLGGLEFSCPEKNKNSTDECAKLISSEDWIKICP